MTTLDHKTIGCIGAGNMGGAILSRLAATGNKENIRCYDINNTLMESASQKLGIQTASGINELADASDIIILAVKPDTIAAVCAEINASGKLIISIAAGISIAAIKKNLRAPHTVIRVMPNTPALVGQGMSVVCSEPGTDPNAEKLAVVIFEKLGRVLILPEKLMDAATALSGCGPAYGFSLIQAMTDGGVRMGIPRDKALLLASQTIRGAAQMAVDASEEPVILRGRVASPGGSTIEAIHILEKAGFSGIVMDAIEAAKTKSEKLGK